VNPVDCFALLNQPRRPWLDPDSLKQKFLALSSEVHPDRVHAAGDAEKRAAQKRYTELNSAYNRLRHPKERLLHLLELELGKKPEQLQPIPADLMTSFIEVGQIGREADSFLEEKKKTKSPLLQVQLFERGEEWRSKLNLLQQRLNSRQEELITQLKSLDADYWKADAKPASMPPELLRRLEELYRLFGFFARWSEQIQERLVQLSL
jgi:DnaJ-domain-containing protein 1